MPARPFHSPLHSPLVLFRRGLIGILSIGLHQTVFAQLAEDSETEAAQRLPTQEVRATALMFPRPAANAVMDRDALIPWGERNAAAALARLPGVTFESENGDARFVIIRGIDPNYNGVTINGANIAAGSPESRATQLDGFELEGFDQIELTKILLPDQPANAVGGLVNFNSPSAFDYPSGHAEWGADLILDFASDELGAGAFVRHARLNATETAGLFVSASLRERSWENESTDTDPFSLENGSYLPDDKINFDQLDVHRERAGGSLNWEQQVGRNGTWFVRGSHTVFNDLNLRQRSELEFEDARYLSALTASGDSIRFQNDSTTSNDDVGVTQSLRERRTDNTLSLWGVGGEFSHRFWTWDFALNRAAAEEGESTIELAYQASRSPDSFTFVVPRGAPARVPSAHEGLGLSAADFDFDEAASETLHSRETNWNGQVNLAREFQGNSPLKRLKVGSHFQLKEKRSEVEAAEFFNAPASFQAREIVTAKASPLLLKIPRDRIAQFQSDQAQFERERDLGESTAGDYRSDEDIFAAFGMAEWETRTTTLTAGARWERAEFESRSQSFDASSNTFTPVSGGRTVDHILPGVHLHYRSPDTIHSTDAWSLQAAYTQTLGRPGFEETKAGVFIEDDEIEIGNPNLKPLHAHNFDLSIGYERPEWGRFEIAAFHKEIDDFIYANRSLYDFDGDGEIDEVREFTNGTSGQITGLELTYQHNLWGKPHSDRRLDLVTSATFVDSAADYPALIGGDLNRDLPFVKQSDRILQVNLEWYHRAWMARLSYHQRSDYLDELGEGTDDIAVDAYRQLDFSLGYQPSRAWSFYVRVENITAEPFRARWVNSQRIAESEKLSPTASFGITWKH
ncbi:MAG: TonB-dependent receptor [Synoicihabitans sp.]